MNKELIAKAREAKSAEELLSLAKENDIELTEDEANEYYDRLHASGELADDELDSVSGGGCDPYEPKCPKCGSKKCTFSGRTLNHHLARVHYYLCLDCGHEYL